MLRRHERALVLWLAAALVLFRSAVFVFFEGAFDSDQAIVGLMAKHLSEGRTLPVFTYGQDYQLAIEAWLAAPLFWVFGPSVFLLKLPLLLINLALAPLLIWLLERELGLRPTVGLLIASPFILAPPGTTIYFLEASGGQVEPLFAVLLLWLTRHRPLTFGVILAFGFLQRVFTAYALGALVLIEMLDRSLFTAAGIRRKVKAAVAFTAVWQAIGLVRAQAGSAWGPATSDGFAGLPVSTADSAGLNVGFLLERFCWDPTRLPDRILAFAGPHLATMFGGRRQPLAELSVASQSQQGVDRLWVLLGGMLLIVLGRLVWMTVRGQTRPWRGRPRFAVYLLLIGLAAGGSLVMSGCGPLDVLTLRYTLLTVLGVTSLVGWFLVAETKQGPRRIVLAVLALWACLALWGHWRLLAEFRRAPPVEQLQVLADYLVDNDIRYGHADFWDAYSTVFLSDEQVILSSTSVWFIQEYEWLVQNHQDEAVWILHEPCVGGTLVTNVHYVCPP